MAGQLSTTADSEIKLPILYSFRRCPYAMRARMVLESSALVYEHREVLLRNKPAEMIEASPKATVPVLVLPDGSVIDQSLDIMHWMLEQHNLNHWVPADAARRDDVERLIAAADDEFKHHLDRYKYSNRYEGADSEQHRSLAAEFVWKLDRQLDNDFLFGAAQTLGDVAIFPFIRQFANTDRAWFDAQDWLRVHDWLSRHLSSAMFVATMAKHPPWVPGDAPMVVNGPDGSDNPGTTST
jgi:glutathione S-transferase